MTVSSLLSLHLLLAPPTGAPSPVPSASQAPLPPPPPPVDPSTIAKGPWRGMGWFGLHAGVGGPIDGGKNFPSSSRVVAMGWGMDIGYRAQPWLGVGLGFHRQPHDYVEVQIQSQDTIFVTDATGYLNSYDLLILRGFLPTQGRIQPWVDVAGGMAVLQGALVGRPSGVGGQFRLGAGADFWIQQQISLDLSLHYRLNSVGGGPGHLLRGALGITFHW